MSLLEPDPQATVLITGASSGIGAELARQLGARGYNLTLVARRKDRLDALAKEIKDGSDVKVDTRKGDVSNQSQRTRLVNSLRDGDLRVDAVCNNAGFSTFGKFQDLPVDHELEQVRVNVVAVHELTAAFLPAMVQRGAGAILNVGSIAGFAPLPGQATYGASKAFVVSFSEAVHTDLGGTGVSCTALCPGPVRSEFFEAAGQESVETTAPSFVWVSAQEAARAGVDGMLKGKRIVYPALKHHAAGVAGRLAPRSVLLPLAERFGFDSL
ncbi:MAG: SDR family oxidoreductase [Actinomycetota bacterium]|nr:SDR family oxidoreductase [Actinomycetota bacterium]